VKRATVAIVAALAFAPVACDEARVPVAPERTVAATPSSPVVPVRHTPRVVIESSGRTRARLVTAVRDLKRVDLWPRLTDHLYEIELDSRAGTANVPPDGHLADAYFTGVVDERGAGPVCDVMFFPSAVAADLVRWRQYYAAGVMASPAPTERAFYAALVAHELAHCRRGARGEPVARAWEARALRAVRAAGLE